MNDRIWESLRLIRVATKTIDRCNRVINRIEKAKKNIKNKMGKK